MNFLSQWFGFYAPGKNNTVLTLQETDLYINVSKSYYKLIWMNLYWKLFRIDLFCSILEL